MLHLLDAGLGELAGERAELLGERDERLQPRRLLGGDRGEIDRVGDRAAQQIVRHLLGDLQRDVLLRLGGGGAEMRRADHVRHGRTAGSRSPAPRRTRRRRRRRPGRTSSAARSAASSTSPPRAQLMMRTPFFIVRDRLGVDDVPGLVGERRVQGDEVGAPEAARRARPSRRRARRARSGDRNGS